MRHPRFRPSPPLDRHPPEGPQRHSTERIPLQQIPRVLELLDALKIQFHQAGHDAVVDYDYVQMEWSLGLNGREIVRAATAEELAKEGLHWLQGGGRG